MYSTDGIGYSLQAIPLCTGLISKVRFSASARAVGLVDALVAHENVSTSVSFYTSVRTEPKTDRGTYLILDEGQGLVLLEVGTGFWGSRILEVLRCLG